MNGVRVYWEQHGDNGAPLVLVHGSWGDHHNWDLVAPRLGRRYRVFTYDRRGHSQSERLEAQGRIEEDVDDLAALVTEHRLAPVFVAGNSYGAAITLKLAAKRPELFAGAIVHEPPLIGMLDDESMLSAVRQRIGAVIATLKAGDLEAGARQFVETVALGPGMWDQLSPEMRQTFVFNALTWLDEMNEPESVMSVDLLRLAEFRGPLLLTNGDQSPPFFGLILHKIAIAVTDVERHTFRGGGHVPHLTHADEYVSVVTDFIDRAAGVSGSSPSR